MSWRMIADLLASRLAHHACCDSHAESEPDPSCPFCKDRAAYLEYLGAGGTDFRSAPKGRPSGLAELFADPGGTHRA